MRRLLLLAPLAFAVAPLHATTYTLEPDYTQGVVRWSHLGFSSPTAQFGQGHGTLEFDPSTPTRAKVDVSIAISTLNTGVPALDEHLRSTTFFDMEHFPTATFHSTHVQAISPMRLKVSGDLTLHGTTKPVVLQVTVVKVGINPRTNLPTVGFDATTTVNRSDFGLGAFVPQVSDAIEIRLLTQAVDAKAYEKYLSDQAKEEASGQK